MQIEDKIVISTFMAYLKSFEMKSAMMKSNLKHDIKARTIITGINENLYNSIFLCEPNDNDKLIDELMVIKQQLKLTLTVWLTAETKAPGLEDKLKKHFETPGLFYGMVLKLSEANLQLLPSDITIEQAESPSQADDFANLFSKIFNFPNLRDRTAAWAVEQYMSDHPASINFLAKVNGKLAGASSFSVNANNNIYLVKADDELKWMNMPHSVEENTLIAGDPKMGDSFISASEMKNKLNSNNLGPHEHHYAL